MGLLDSILGSALGGSEGQGGARDPKVALLIGLVTMLMSRQGGAAQGGGDGGGLLGSLGSILGGAGGGAASGGLGGVLGDLLGGAAGGAGQAAPGVEAGSLGGLGGLFQMLQNAGLGDALNSGSAVGRTSRCRRRTFPGSSATVNCSNWRTPPESARARRPNT